MDRFFRFSPSRFALICIALSVLVLALFAIPLWYAWQVNLSTFRTYVEAENTQAMADLFKRDGAGALAAAIESRVPGLAGDEVLLLADASKSRLAGNLGTWPREVPDAPGTYGLVIETADSSMRVVVSHVTLPGGYHLLVGRESARFQSLVDLFWYGIAGATCIVLILGIVVGWLIRRSLLAEVHEISRNAAAIVDGDLTRRLEMRGGSKELAVLAQTVNGMLEQLASKNERLGTEIMVRGEAEQALHAARSDLEHLVDERTKQLEQANESLESALQGTQSLKDEFQLAIDTIPGLVWSALPDGHIDYLNQRWQEYTGLTLAQASGWGWRAAIHPDDVDGLTEYWKSVLASGQAGEGEARLKRYDGEYRWFLFRALPLYDDAGNLRKWYGTNTDIEDRKCAEAFLEREKRLLEMIAKGTPLDATLESLCRHVEDISGGIMCSVMLIDAASGRLRYAAAPNLPQGYVAATGDWPSDAGPCGMAASHREPVIASDLANDTRWREYGKVASTHGIRACWSTPIISSEGKVLGTFAMLSAQPRSPAPEYRNTIEQVTHIASIAIERTLAEDELRRQKAHLDELFDMAPDAIVLTDLSHPRILRINNEFARVFGYAPEEAVGQRLRHLIVPDDVPPAGLADNPAVLAGKKVESEVVRRRKDGSRFHAHVTAKRVRFQGDDDAAYLIYRDISDSKRAEAALRLSEERYALAVQAAGEGHSDWNFESGEFFLSPRLLEICGHPPTEKFKDRADWVARFPFHPEDRPKWEKAIAEHMAGSASLFHMEVRTIVRGETRWVRFVFLCIRDAAGKPIRWTGSTSDITDRKRAEQELRARQEMLDLAQKAAQTVAYEWRIDGTDAKGRPKWAVRTSPELDAMYGHAAGTFDGSYQSWKKLVHPDDWSILKDSLRLARQSGDIAAEYRIVQPGGEVRWLQSKGTIMFDASGLPERMVGFVLDITARRKSEEELRRLEHQLRQAQRLEAMGTLAGGIAHDFNNILGAILGYGEMAMRDAPKGGRLHRDLDSIMSAGERGRALVDRILTFSRSGVGERVAVHVEKVVREALDLLMANLPSAITVKAELSAGRAAMHGDPTQVHQVFMNLATNGIQAMSGGGTLRVSLSEVHLYARRDATIGSLAAGDYILLKVADAGRGIPAVILDRIFDPFFTTKDVGVGTGLGLSLVHGIVTEVGGAIDVETSPGAGTTFRVYFPHVGYAEHGAANEEPILPHGDRQRILIVDDEEPLVRLTTETLEELGYMATGFTSSAEAMKAFRASPGQFDAVITDERMPGLSGTVLIEEIRGIRRSIPILLVSGYVGGMVMGRAYNSGADEVLKKPLSARDLADSLARVLNAKPVTKFAQK